MRPMKIRKSASRVREPACEPLESRVLLSASFQVVGYLPDYEFTHFNSIDLSALTQINYFSVVATVTGSLGTTSASGYSFSQLQTVVAAAHAAPQRVSVNITVDPSSQFQTIAGSPTATTNFVNNILAFCSTYKLDGIDLDYEPVNGSLTQTQMNSWGSFLATLHAATSSHGLKLSEAVQVSPPYIIPKAYLSDVDQYNVMVYDLDYNSSAPDSSPAYESRTYLAEWATYAASGGVPKTDLMYGMPFFGSSGTGWDNSTAETYAQIVNAYAAANGGAFPAANLDSVTINGTTWGYNGIDTVEEKTQYAIQNGYGGVMIWELGQDYFTSGGYGAPSLLPAIKSVVGAAYETWTGSVSNSWSTPGNWNFGQVPGSSTAVVINGGTPTISSPFSVTSLVLNGGTLTLAAGGGDFTTSLLTVNPGATLDLGNNTLLINYGTTADPISSIAASIVTGYADGAWNGQGIKSSAPMVVDGLSYGIGYADSADLGNPANLPSGTIKVMYTLLGDVNLDGTVNSEDFTQFSQHVGQSGVMWDDGDFNYDGTVNSEDFTLLSQNLNQAVTQSAPLAATDPANDSVQLASQDQITSTSQFADYRHHRSTQKK
jgi:chitinase